MLHLSAWSRNVYSAAAISLVAWVFLLSPTLAWSQANSATFYGSVTDPTGAVVRGAAVTLTDRDTGTTIKKTTADTGDFAFTFVPGGTYTLRIEASGFRPYAATGITLAAGQQVRQAFQLELGSVTDTVTVEGVSPL